MAWAPSARPAPQAPSQTPLARRRACCAPRVLLATPLDRPLLLRRALVRAQQETAWGWAPLRPLPLPAWPASSVPRRLLTRPKFHARLATTAPLGRARALQTRAPLGTFRRVAQHTRRRQPAQLALPATATARAALPPRLTPAPQGTCARAQRLWQTSAPRAPTAQRAPRWLPPAQRARFLLAAPPTLRFPRAALAARATAWPLVACLFLQILARRATTALHQAPQVQPKRGALRDTFAPPPPALLRPHPPLHPAPWARLALAARLSRPPPRVAHAARAFALPWQAIRPAQTPVHPATTAPSLPLDSRKTRA